MAQEMTFEDHLKKREGQFIKFLGGDDEALEFWKWLGDEVEWREMKKTIFSPCRKYRYTLWRHWGGLFVSSYAMFIGLNPSTADETHDDPTIRRCIGFARDWGYAGLCMTNLFSFRSTLPAEMKVAEDPIGPDNNRYLSVISKNAGVIVAAWGVDGGHLGRDKGVRELIPNLNYLKLTKDGYPAHPLYLPKDLKPTKWGKSDQEGVVEHIRE